MIKNISKYNNSKYTYRELITNLMKDKDDCAIYSYVFTKIFGKVLYGIEWKISKKLIKKYKANRHKIIKEFDRCQKG